MSMAVITFFQLLKLLAVYLLITVFLPHFVLGKTLKLKSRYEKFITYTVIGNFYVINLIYLLEILHIAYPVTIFLFTFGPIIVLKIILENIPVKDIVLEKIEILRRLVGGQLKFKAYISQRIPEWKLWMNKVKLHFYRVYFKNLTDVIGIIFIIGIVFWSFGLTHFEQFGYKASDEIVHNYWINEMSDNNIFCTGVYPYGFHCIVFFMKSLFGIDTYIILRLLAWIETLWVILIAFCFLKIVCKSKYMPYIGIIVYSLAKMYRLDDYGRYAASLPQEYGMIFIVPVLYFLYAFFRQQRKESRGDVSNRSRLYLMLLAMSFSLTFTIHFYGTIVAGLICVAVAIGFCVWCFKVRNLRRLLITALLSILIAITPLSMGLIMGKGFQASLNWGMNVLSGKGDDVEVEVDDTVTDDDESGKLVTNRYEIEEKYGKVIGSAVFILRAVRNNMFYNVFSIERDNINVLYIFLLIIPTLIGCGIYFILRRDKDSVYGMTAVSIGVLWIFMCILISLVTLGLPVVMDANRSRVYFAYFTCITIPFTLDSILYIFAGKLNDKKRISNAISLLCVAFTLVLLISGGFVRERLKVNGAELNDAITCLTKIINDEKKFSWTIISANDENRMARDSGFHYEIIRLLDNMEYVGARGRVCIPTENVFVFIEKIPGDYYQPYENSGQSISEAGCENRLPMSQGLSCYQGENRWIVMSRAYAWANKFMELYPNEVSVYWESDEFICYKIVQNPYRLFNFAIDYDYNLRVYPVREEIEE